MKNLLVSAVVLGGLGVSAAQAASVSIGVTSFGSVENADLALVAAKAAQDAFHGLPGTFIFGVEDFESYALGDAGVPFDSVIGGIDRIAPAGNGAGNTVIGNPDDLQVRNDGAGSRSNTTTGGDQYLDSNDNAGISFDIPGISGISTFDRVSFFTTDVDDVQSIFFTVTAEGSAVPVTILSLPAELGNVQRPNGELLLWTLTFDTRVADVVIDLFTTAEGDGFGVDDITVSAVPLPAAAWMLLSGIGALAGVGSLRRRGARAVA